MWSSNDVGLLEADTYNTQVLKCYWLLAQIKYPTSLFSPLQSSFSKNWSKKGSSSFTSIDIIVWASLSIFRWGNSLVVGSRPHDISNKNIWRGLGLDNIFLSNVISLECIELEIKFVKNRHFYILINQNQTDLLKEKKYRLLLLSTFIIWNNGTATSL